MKWTTLFCAGLILLIGCQAESSDFSPDQFPNHDELQTRNTWMDGTAEISSFRLTQAHYGKTYSGEAVMIFVSEPFLPNKHVKDEANTEKGIDVLKLNYKKFFVTGVYPYSSMTSVFTPLSGNQRLDTLKANNSTQDWCGQSFAQINRRDQALQINEYSYFEQKADASYQLPRITLEDELWNIIRLDPKNLPTGTFSLLPSLMRQRLQHMPVQAIPVSASLNTTRFAKKEAIAYQIKHSTNAPYKTIYFSQKYPYEILGWEELLPNGQVTRAQLIEKIRSPYWEKNTPRDNKLRNKLKIEGS